MSKRWELDEPTNPIRVYSLGDAWPITIEVVEFVNSDGSPYFYSRVNGRNEHCFYTLREAKSNALKIVINTFGKSVELAKMALEEITPDPVPSKG